MSVSGFGRAGAVAAARSPLTLAVLRKEVDMAKKLADIEDMGAPGIVRLLHNTAVQRGYMAYADPATGYNVWTTLKLRQRNPHPRTQHTFPFPLAPSHSCFTVYVTM